MKNGQQNTRARPGKWILFCFLQQSSVTLALFADRPSFVLWIAVSDRHGPFSNFADAALCHDRGFVKWLINLKENDKKVNPKNRI